MPCPYFVDALVVFCGRSSRASLLYLSVHTIFYKRADNCLWYITPSGFSLFFLFHQLLVLVTCFLATNIDILQNCDSLSQYFIIFFFIKCICISYYFLLRERCFCVCGHGMPCPYFVGVLIVVFFLRTLEPSVPTWMTIINYYNLNNTI
jgi:hypothetical protein